MIAALFDTAFDAGTSHWHLLPSGEWDRHDRGPDGERLIDLQAQLIASSRTALPA